MLMTVVSIEGDLPVTTFTDPGPVFQRVRVNLEGTYGDLWYVLGHDETPPRIGDVFQVTHGPEGVRAVPR